MAPKSVTFRRHDHLVSVLYGDLLSHSYNITFSMFLYLVIILAWQKHTCTFLAPLCLMLSNNRQSKRQFASLLRNSKLEQSSHTLMWPTFGGTLINEFTMHTVTERYFRLAFPTLLPTGAADFLGQQVLQSSHHWQLIL